MSKLKEANVIYPAALSRRDLLRGLGLTAGAAALLGAAGRGSAAFAAGQGIQPAARIILALDSGGIGVRAVEGGNASGQVALEPVVDDLVQRKQLAGVKYEDLVLQIPLADAKPLGSWISTTLIKGPTARSGALIYLNSALNQVKRLEFDNAFLTEVTLPACDAQANDEAILTLRLAPESTRWTGPGSGVPTLTPPRIALTRNFRMNVQTLETAGPSTIKVSALTARRPLPANAGIERKQPSVLDCSKLSITLPENNAGPFFQWLNDFMLQGNAAAERAGRLEWLSSTAAVIASADFGNLGIVRYAPVVVDESYGIQGPQGMTVAFVQVDMYCETMNLTVL